MKNLKKLLVITVLFFNILPPFGGIEGGCQNIGINEPNPDNSALLEMTSSERGLLIPRMTTVQRDAIASPAQSLLIYNITEKCLQIWENAQWNDIWCSSAPCVAPAITIHPVDVSINDGDNANYSVTATGTAPLTYQWQENDGGGWLDITNGGTNPAYSGATSVSLMLTNVPASYDTYDYQCVVTNACGSATSNSADLTVATSLLICGSPTAIVDVTNPITGDTWMDRNLGASQQATAYDDYLAYGALFQWGRLSDGHECITWTSSTTSDGAEQANETSTNSSTDVPGHSDFILEPNSPYDWRDPQNDNLWQGVSGINNPCPSGYRLPTEAELDNERASWSSQDYNGAYASPLKLVVAGYRRYSAGTLFSTGSGGNYRSSSVAGIFAPSLYFTSSDAYMSSNHRAYGFSVRCIKD